MKNILFSIPSLKLVHPNLLVDNSGRLQAQYHCIAIPLLVIHSVLLVPVSCVTLFIRMVCVRSRPVSVILSELIVCR
jgi:hypothetical protein